MIQITTAQWYAWISAFILPFLRILGLVLADPVFGNRSVPVAARIGLALFVTLLVAPVLPEIPPVEPASAAGVLIAVQQLAIGLAMGFAVRIALAAAETAGQLAGLQMGLGFAAYFDPQGGAQPAVVGQFVGLFAILVFLATNGHAVVLGVLVESFRALPVAQAALDPVGWRLLVEWGAVIFSSGLIISLPVIAALLIANAAVGIMTRAASQLGMFTVGFPVTLIAGFVALYLAAPFMAPALAGLFEQAMLAIGRVVSGLAGP